MKFSRKTDYGVMLLTALRVTFNTTGFIPLSSVTREYNLPFSFLEKLAEALKGAGYLASKRGPEGGYRLIRDPKTVTLKELIAVFEEPPMMKCLKSADPEKHCAFVAVCPTRKTWNLLNNKVMDMFEHVTLAEM